MQSDQEQFEIFQWYSVINFLVVLIIVLKNKSNCRSGYRAAATSKMLTIITKRSIWDAAAALDPPLNWISAVGGFFCENLIPDMRSTKTYDKFGTLSSIV